MRDVDDLAAGSRPSGLTPLCVAFPVGVYGKSGTTYWM
jgi:hypothetical protein